jgi:hypothetical protein
MSEPARPVETEVDPGGCAPPVHLGPKSTYVHELAACEAIIEEVFAAKREFRAGNPIAARMHVFDANAKCRALWSGESV